jgi:hypothetical protein
MSYRMKGRFYEACDCLVPCPCWFDHDPQEDECTGVVAWQIENGSIEDVDVTGLNVVSVSQHGGHRNHAHHMRVALLVDSRANDAQHHTLRRAFSGKLGGPLGELATVTGTLAAVEAADITFVEDNGKARLDVPRRVAVRSSVVRGPANRAITIVDGLLSTLLGSPGVVGKSSRFKVTFAAAGIDVGLSGRSTTSGRFSYHVGD